MRDRILKKGDIVGRKSYGKDIAFFISDILEKEQVAILKGITIRIIADSPISDLEIFSPSEVDELIAKFEVNLAQSKKLIINQKVPVLKRHTIRYGKILHLDGDKKYSEKSQKFYKSLGLNVVVKNISEDRQPQFVTSLLNRYRPDILVITGHDGMIKKGHNYNDIYNYRNSRFFVETVMRARLWERGRNNIAIFAGACQSYYEALIEAGANFASSPARILIDFKDPLIVAEKIATTEDTKYITIKDIEDELRDGIDGVSGVGAYGKKINF